MFTVLNMPRSWAKEKRTCPCRELKYNFIVFVLLHDYFISFNLYRLVANYPGAKLVGGGGGAFK